jgi:hypothetical protein
VADGGRRAVGGVAALAAHAVRAGAGARRADTGAARTDPPAGADRAVGSTQIPPQRSVPLGQGQKSPRRGRPVVRQTQPRWRR